MPRNNGIYEPPINNWNPAINERPMDPDSWNQLLRDLSDALTQSVSKDGQTKLTGDLDFNGHKIVNLGAPQNSGDSISLSMLSKGADIASAESIQIPMKGQLFKVTGTTSISEIHSPFDGKLAFLEFEDAVSIAGSTDLIIPGGGNYQTAPGEVVLFVARSPASGYIFPIMQPSVAPQDVWAAVLAI